MFGTKKQLHTNKVMLSNGCNVAYIDEGTGNETLVFIHGLATYGYSWAANIIELKKHYRCIAIDLPGNGFSDKGEYPYGIDYYAGCVYDFLQKLNLQHVILVGHSMGGQIALRLVINQPDACYKIALCAPAGFETFNAVERTLYQTGISIFDIFSSDEYNLRETIKTSFYNYPKHIESMVAELIKLMKAQPTSQYRKMIQACITGMMNEPVFEQLHTIQQPTLVLFGTQDALIPNKLIHPVSTQYIAEQGTNAIPYAKLSMLQNCGHFIQLEKPTEVNEQLREFIG